MFHGHFSANPRSIFLLDGFGALLSTLLLLVIASLEDVFGMPENIIYKLVPVTTIYTAFSFGSYIVNPTNWKPYLTYIAIANILYCSLTFMLFFYYFNKLTTFGIAYFVLEMLVILLLSRIELGLTYNKPGHK